MIMVACIPIATCGNQIWMTINMNVGTMAYDHTTSSTHSHQNNDDLIEKYCYNNIIANCNMYGGLYEWTEALQLPNTNNWKLYGYPTWMICDPCNSQFPGRQGICPDGFHVPTDLESSRYEWCVETTISPTGNTPLNTFQNGIGYRGENSNAGPGHKMKVPAVTLPPGLVTMPVVLVPYLLVIATTMEVFVTTRAFLSTYGPHLNTPKTKLFTKV